jgi:hypothetical protein
MSAPQTSPLSGETLITLDEAAEDFGGHPVPISTVRNYIYYGTRGVKLETVLINRRYTSKEAIQRFLENRQKPSQPTKPKMVRLTQEQVDAGLKRYGIAR